MSKKKSSYQGSRVGVNNQIASDLNKVLSKRKSKFNITLEQLLWEYNSKGLADKMTFEEYRESRIKKYVEKQKTYRERRDKKLSNARNGSMLAKPKKKKSVNLISEKLKNYYDTLSKGKKI